VAGRGIDDLSGHEFEDLVEALLQKMGLTTEGRKASADGGIDIIAHNPQPVVGGKLIVQCKRYAAPVSVPVVRDLFGVVTDERASKGILISTSRFTREAEEFAADKPIELIDRDRLLELLGRHQVQAAVRVPGNLQTLAETLRPAMARALERFNDVDRRLVTVPQRSFKARKGYPRWHAEKERKLKAASEALARIITLSLPRYVLSPEASPTLAKGDARRIAAALAEIEKGWEACLGCEAPWLLRGRLNNLVDRHKRWLAYGLQIVRAIDDAARGVRPFPREIFAGPLIGQA